MDETMNSVQGEVATPTETAPTEVETSPTEVPSEGEVNLDNANQEPAEDTKAKQDPKTNSAFAEMRREKEALQKQVEQAKRDTSIAKKYGKEYGVYSESDIATMYGDRGITTLEHLENAIEAQTKNVDPEMYQKLKDMETKLNSYESEKQLKVDRERLAKSEGKIFEKVADRSEELAKQFGTDLETGYTLALKEKANELFSEPDIESIKESAIKEYIEKIKNGNSPVETSGSAGAVVKTPKTFDEARAGALAMLKAARNQ